MLRGRRCCAGLSLSWKVEVEVEVDLTRRSMDGQPLSDAGSLLSEGKSNWSLLPKSAADFSLTPPSAPSPMNSFSKQDQGSF